MGMRVARVWSLVLVLGAGGLSACTPSSSDGAVEAASADGVVEQAQDLERSLAGIWSTAESRGDDAETVYAIEWQESSGLQILRDGVWLQGAVEDVDVYNGTLAFRLTRENGPDETLTLRQVEGPASGDGISLRIIWGTGRSETLGFVRRLTERDHQELVLAIRQAAVLPQAVACGGDAPAGGLRATLACSESEFSELDRHLRTQLVELSARYPDGDRTAAAVVHQLDACSTPECLRDGYAQWQTYFDENYDLGDVLDYL